MTEPAGDETGLRRRAYRAFIRTHHPDRGGDPAVFAAGLAAFRQGGADHQQLQFHRRRRGLGAAAGWWLDRRARRRRAPRVH